MTKSNFEKLYIKKRPVTQWLTYFIFVFPFFFGTLIDMIGLPGVVRYIVDVAWVALAMLLILRKRISLNKKITPLVVLICVFFIYTLIVYLFNFQSPIYYLWGFRNNFRFYVAFIAFCMFFDEDDANQCLKILDYLFWINAVITAIQFIFLGLEQDYLGGIFGTERGCNSSTIIFFSIIISKSILCFMNGTEKVALCISKCAVAVFISVLAELKVFFVFFIAIIAMAAVFTSFSWRKMSILVVGAVFFMIGSSMLVVMFGANRAISFERIWELATSANYATAEDINRLSAVPTIARTILTKLYEQFFGMGLGNCDTSTFEICNTPFYQNYAHLHYTWFSIAFLFLETGYIGLMLYTLFFLLCFVFARKLSKSKTSNLLFCQMGMIMAAVACVLIVYNSSLRTEAGYMVYFSLALPFIYRSAGNDTAEDEKSMLNE